MVRLAYVRNYGFKNWILSVTGLKDPLLFAILVGGFTFFAWMVNSQAVGRVLSMVGIMILLRAIVHRKFGLLEHRETIATVGFVILLGAFFWIGVSTYIDEHYLDITQTKDFLQIVFIVVPCSVVGVMLFGYFVGLFIGGLVLGYNEN